MKSPEPQIKILNNVTEMFLILLSTKIAHCSAWLKTVQLGWMDVQYRAFWRKFEVAIVLGNYSDTIFIPLNK